MNGDNKKSWVVLANWNLETGEWVRVEGETGTIVVGEDATFEEANFNRVVGVDVEHFRPKSTITVETFKWKNLVTACPSAPRVPGRASGVLEWVATKVPKRIDTEEIGDALERIHRLVAGGRPSWVIYVAVARACWAVLWHSLRHGAEQLVGVVKIAMGQGDDRG